jgi:flagellar basal body P-ring formation protein FlgA
MRTLILLIFATLAAHAACISVPSDRIVARDLAGAVAIFQGLDPETQVGFAPMPGTQRILAGRELILLAQRHGVVVSAGTIVADLCVQREAHVISKDEMKAALLAALGIADADLELIEFTSQALPPGRLEFQRGALNKPPPSAPESPIIWRGRLIYDGQHSAVVWAKVRITVERQVVIAAEEIPAGTVIRAEQIKSISGRQFPFSAPSMDSIEQAIGKVTRRSIPAGQRIGSGALEDAKEVTRGEKVHVRVIDGLATLSFEGIAESAGKKGDSILVHNPASGRNFRAVIEEKGKVVVRPSPGA